MLDLVADLVSRKGVNVILSSHLLPDVEATCDRVVVMHQGAIAAQGAIAELKERRRQVFEVRIKGDVETFAQALEVEGVECRGTDEDVMRVFLTADQGPRDLFAVAAQHQIQVRHFRPSVPTLEDVFAEAIGEE
jgi:ABC-2 type transport system ATP-binding protein